MIACGGSVRQIVESGALRQRSLLRQATGERARLAAPRGPRAGTDRAGRERLTPGRAALRCLRQVSPRSWRMAGAGKRRQTEIHA
jgi:hypothetical protein